MPDFVEKASEFLVERVAPVLVGRRGRDPRHRMQELEQQAREELEARIGRGRPEPSEWPNVDQPVPVAEPSAPEPVVVAAELQVVAVRMTIPPAAERRQNQPTPVAPSRRG